MTVNTNIYPLLWKYSSLKRCFSRSSSFFKLDSEEQTGANPIAFQCVIARMLVYVRVCERVIYAPALAKDSLVVFVPVFK